MKTCLFSSCYLEGSDAAGSNRFDRTVRYYEYYQAIKHLLGYDDVYVIDNGSSDRKLDYLEERCPKLIVYQEDNIPSNGGRFDYPYCWRALYFMETMIRCGYKKVIFIDTDGFVLTRRLAEHIRTLSTGWESFHCPKYDFPDSAFHILCEDAFPIFDKFTKDKGWPDRNGSMMELELPFTKVNRNFDCDRYGEDSTLQRPGMDYYGQAKLTDDLKFERYL